MTITYNHATGAMSNVATKDNRRISPKVRARNVPGMRCILLGFYATAFTLCTPIFYYFSIPVPLRYINLFGWSIVFVIVVMGTIMYVRSLNLRLLYRKSHLVKVKIWFFLTVILTVYGFILGTPLDDIGKEMIAFSYIGIFLLFGGDDRFWYIAIRHLMILFYIGVVLSLLFIKVPAPILTYSGITFDLADPINFRYTNSIGYLFRPLIMSGIFLGMWGLVRRNGGVSRILQIFALFFFLLINVFFFQFRSVALLVLIGGLGFLLVRPLLERRVRLGISAIFLSLVILGFIYYTTTESFEMFMERGFIKYNKLIIFNSRQAELDAYVSDIGWGALIGRGLGGTFDASSVYGQLYGYERGARWATMHYGILGFTLKGGSLCLLSFASFLWPGFSLRRSTWYQNPRNLTAALLFPIYLISFILNSISLSPAMIIVFASSMMVMARFGRQN